VVTPLGLFYGAGYVQGLKPSFLLAELAETRQVEGSRSMSSAGSMPETFSRSLLCHKGTPS